MTEGEQPGNPRKESDQQPPEPEIYQATVVREPKKQEREIRVGSPFRSDSVGVPSQFGSSAPLVPGYDPQQDGSAAFELGVLASTAWGGVIAAYFVLPFAIVSAWLFPLGAILVGGLGCGLAVFGLSSRKNLPTIAALLGHLIAGIAGYIQFL